MYFLFYKIDYFLNLVEIIINLVYKNKYMYFVKNKNFNLKINER